MTDYARVRIDFEVSEFSDYGSPYIRPPQWSEALTPDEADYKGRVEAALTPGTTIATAFLTTCTLLAVRNLDATNYVTLTWRSAGNGSTDNVVRIAAGDVFVTQDVTAGNDPNIMANTAACKCEVLVMGT